MVLLAFSTAVLCAARCSSSNFCRASSSSAALIASKFPPTASVSFSTLSIMSLSDFGSLMDSTASVNSRIVFLSSLAFRPNPGIFETTFDSSRALSRFEISFLASFHSLCNPSSEALVGVTGGAATHLNSHSLARESSGRFIGGWNSCNSLIESGIVAR